MKIETTAHAVWENAKWPGADFSYEKNETTGDLMLFGQMNGILVGVVMGARTSKTVPQVERDKVCTAVYKAIQGVGADLAARS